ncbi:MAG: asparagine synthase (glutamine-hydrolyzing) [Candidatus Omnitrophica bacterium]|nr:asparagine synthase (glutamine-hydrolyzing) [Candidatus Omnitrophota bacterium]
MCGIAGIVRFDGRPVEEELLERMTQMLAHRGPDGQGVQAFRAGAFQAGFGHARLKIIDLSDAAAQPMVNEDGTIAVVFNGEIYNYRELRQELLRPGIACRTSSDTEVILRLYEAEGSRGVRRLEGMFALAIWDARTGCVLLARDRVGKKPLFYYATPALAAFASEIKALVCHPDVPAEVDAEALPAFFLYGYVPSPRTVYRGIRKLGPGELMTIQADGRITRESYWNLELPPEADARRAPSDAEAIARVRELMTAAVRRRMIADVPLGAFLSGGIDSTIVVGLMSQASRRPVRTFSIGFSSDPRFDETRYARLASTRFNTAHTEFVVEPSAIELVERLVWHHDGPFADSSAIPTYLLAQLTRQHVTVALTGDGGDEVFAGYLRFYAAILCERIPSPVRQAVHRLLGATPERAAHRSLWRRVQKFAGSAALPFAERFTRWISVFYEDLPELVPGGLGTGVVQEALRPVHAALEEAGGASPLSRLLALNLKTYLLDDLLVKMDRCTMAHGLEARSPFLDRELLEYAFSLPDAMKLRWGRTKVILRRAFADLVPPEILQRGKMGFGVPLQAWFARDLRDYLQDVLLGPEARLRAHVDHAYVRRLWDAHVRGEADHSHRLWTLLTFEVWLRQGLRQPAGMALR